jgi:hypothetical protein
VGILVSVRFFHLPLTIKRKEISHSPEERLEKGKHMRIDTTHDSVITLPLTFKQVGGNTMEPCKNCSKVDTVSETGYCEECKRDNTITQHKDSVSDSQSNVSITSCLCGNGPMTVKTLMQCTNCTNWWHPACVGLLGLTKTHTKLIKEWKCPTCFVFREDLALKVREEINVFTEDHDSSDMQQEVKKGVKAAIPDIITGIKEALMGENSQVETFAQITQRNLPKIIKEVVQETSKSALQESMQYIDANLTEQKKRVRNAVISGVNEDYGREGTTLKEVTIELLGSECSSHDIVTVKRLGLKKEESKRPILVVFKSEETAQFFHNYGTGWKVTASVWVNPDLTRTERDAQYKKRNARREKFRNRPPVRSGATIESDNAEDAAPPSGGEHRASEDAAPPRGG